MAKRPPPGGGAKDGSEDESAPLFFLFALLTCILVPWTLSVLWSFLFPGKAEIEKAFPEKSEKGKPMRYCQTEKMVEKRRAAIAKLQARSRMLTSGFICRAVIMLLLWVWLIYIMVQVRQVMATSKLYQNFEPHRILEVSRGSSTAEVKKAFRKMSLQYHPDKPTGDAEKFMLVKKAYDVLTDPTAKYNYERWGNPDGPTNIEISCALPTVGKELQGIVLVAFVLLFVIGIPVLLLCCMGDGGNRQPTLQVDPAELKKGMDVDDVQNVLLRGSAAAAEANPLPPRPGEADALEALRKAVGVSPKAATKERLLLAAHMQRKLPEGTTPVEAALLCDLETMLVQWQSILTVLMEASKATRCPKSLTAAVHFHQCLVQAIEPGSMSLGTSTLLQVPHLTADHIQQLRKGQSKITGLLPFLELPAEDRQRRLEALGLGAGKIADIEEAAAYMPAVSVTSAKVFVDGEDEICEGDTATLEVVLQRPGLPETAVCGGVHAPYFPGVLSNEVWWMLMNIPGKDGKTAITCTSVAEQKVEARIKFVVPRVGKLRVKVNLLCAMYVGLDLEHEVAFQAKEAPDGAESHDTDDEVEVGGVSE
mmetsp:Transcript_12351/g.28999  ORF Transcript_12351/g.28999 Transcript_12351/m.28999 type:complete len:592 (-) Transcript_12351:35-1810(-)